MAVRLVRTCRNLAVATECVVRAFWVRGAAGARVRKRVTVALRRGPSLLPQEERAHVVHVRNHALAIVNVVLVCCAVGRRGEAVRSLAAVEGAPELAPFKHEARARAML